MQRIKEVVFCNRQALCNRNKESRLQDKDSLLPGVDSPSWRFSSTEKDSLLHAKTSRPPKKASLIQNNVDYEILCINVWGQLVLCVADEPCYAMRILAQQLVYVRPIGLSQWCLGACVDWLDAAGAQWDCQVPVCKLRYSLDG